jgi:hypothetical protein
MSSIKKCWEYVIKKKPRNYFRMIDGLESMRKSDLENRIHILNGDYRLFAMNSEARSSIAADPVYQMLQEAHHNPENAFAELRKRSGLVYNSKHSEELHETYFNGYLYGSAMKFIQDRKMSENMYTQLLEKGLMHVYEESKKRMDSISKQTDLVEVA